VVDWVGGAASARLISAILRKRDRISNKSLFIIISITMTLINEAEYVFPPLFRRNLREQHSSWIILLSLILATACWRRSWIEDLEPDLNSPQSFELPLQHDINLTESSFSHLLTGPDSVVTDTYIYWMACGVLHTFEMQTIWLPSIP
jgi:hypothetical protein